MLNTLPRSERPINQTIGRAAVLSLAKGEEGTRGYAEMMSRGDRGTCQSESIDGVDAIT